MTIQAVPGTILPTKYDPKLDPAKRLLSPLLDGLPVYLSVHDRWLPKKKRKYKTLLCIQPLPAALSDGHRLWLASMPPYGSEILDLGSSVKTIEIARLGLSLKCAKALTVALNDLLGGRR